MLKTLKRGWRELAALLCPYRVAVYDRKSGKFLAVYSCESFAACHEWLNLNLPIRARFVIQRLGTFGQVEREIWGVL